MPVERGCLSLLYNITGQGRRNDFQRGGLVPKVQVTIASNTIFYEKVGGVGAVPPVHPVSTPL